MMAEQVGMEMEAACGEIWQGKLIQVFGLTKKHPVVVVVVALQRRRELIFSNKFNLTAVTVVCDFCFISLSFVNNVLSNSSNNT